MTTNNRMELTAAIRALEALKGSSEVELYTDSNYLRGGITSWIKGWKRNGWRTADKKAVRHMETLKVRRLPVINKNKRMVGILSLGDLSTSASTELLSEWAKSVSAHHH